MAVTVALNKNNPSPRLRGTSKKLLFFVFILSIILRFLFFKAFEENNPCQLMFDSGHYHSIAVKLVEGKGFAKKNGATQFYRLPVYPLFLAGCYKLFGVKPKIALWVQLILAALIPLLMFTLCLKLFPGCLAAATCASVITALHPGYLIFSGLIMTETLFSLFFILFFIFFLPSFSFFFERKKIVKPHLIKLLLAGATLGIATLIRPLGHYVFSLSLILLLFSSYSFGKKIKSMSLFSLGWIGTAGIWILRNYLLTGYLFLHTLTGVHFLNHMAIKVAMQADNISYQQAREQVNEEFVLAQKEKNEKLGRPLLAIEENNIAEKIALKHVLANPLTSIKLGIINILKTFFSLYSSELLVIDSQWQLPSYEGKRTFKDMILKYLNPDVTNKNILYVIYLELLFLFFWFFGFGLFKLYALFNKEKFFLLLKLAPFMALLVGITLACGFARLRLPFEPFLIIVSSKFWIDSFKRKKVESEQY